MPDRTAAQILHDLKTELAASPDFNCLSSPEEKIVCLHELQSLCADHLLWPRLDALIAGGTLIKHDHASTVARVTQGNNVWVIKRYNHRNLRYSLRQWLAGPRARHAFLRGLLLERIGVPTPSPLLYCVRYRHRLPWCSYIVNQCSAGTPIGDLFDRGELASADWPRVVAAARQQIATLHRHGLTHGDVKTPNLLWDGKTLEVIDLDAMRLHRWRCLFSRFKAKDERTLAQRVEAYPERGGVK